MKGEIFVVNFKKNSLSDQKERYGKAFLIAFGTIVLAFLPFLLMNKGCFIYMGDYNAQQIPFYMSAHRAVRSGAVLWDWYTDLGANFIGSYTYYMLGSPFFWLMLPFPTSWVPYLLGPVLALKIGCAAVTAYAYIRRRASANAACIGGVLYALSGWSIYNIYFNQFHESMIVFPLLLLAMDKKMEDGKKGLFALTVALAAITNYYFFFGMAIFAVLYWLCKTVTKEWAFHWKQFLGLLLEAVLGVMIAATYLIPSALAVFSMPRLGVKIHGVNTVVYNSWKTYAHILYSVLFAPEAPAIPVSFEEAGTAWSSTSAWLPVFGIVFALAWMNRNRKKSNTVLFLLCAVFAFVPVLNSVFNLFDINVYMRWYYMPVLLLCCMTAQAIDSPEECRFGIPYKITLGLMTLFVLVFGFWPSKNSDGSWRLGLYKAATEEMSYSTRFWFFVVISMLSMLFLALLIVYLRKNKEKFYRYATVLVSLIAFGTTFVTVAFGKSCTYNANSYYVDKLINGTVSLPVTDRDRISAIVNDNNDGMYLGYRTDSAFHSIVPTSIIELYQFLGENYTVSRRMDGDKTALMSLVGTKYLLSDPENTFFLEFDNGNDYYSEKSEVKEKYGTVLHAGCVKIGEQNGYEIYENQYQIPMGVLYAKFVSYSEAEKLPEEYRDDLMLKTLILPDEYISAHRNTTLKSMTELTDITTLQFTEVSYFEDAMALAENSIESFAITKTGFNATSSSAKDEMVFFAVPYDSGWTATVDGRPVEIVRSNAGFMSVAVSGGTHNIEFHYFTPGLKVGLITSGIGIILLVVYWIVSKKKNRV